MSVKKVDDSQWITLFDKRMHFPLMSLFTRIQSNRIILLSKPFNTLRYNVKLITLFMKENRQTTTSLDRPVYQNLSNLIIFGFKVISIRLITLLKKRNQLIALSFDKPEFIRIQSNLIILQYSEHSLCYITMPNFLPSTRKPNKLQTHLTNLYIKFQSNHTKHSFYYFRKDHIPLACLPQLTLELNCTLLKDYW